MGNRPLYRRELGCPTPPFILRSYAVLAKVSRGYPPPKGTFLFITHPFATLLTLAGFRVRLACVRHAASVRSEPESNSNVWSWSVNVSLTVICFYSIRVKDSWNLRFFKRALKPLPNPKYLAILPSFTIQFSKNFFSKASSVYTNWCLWCQHSF